MVLTFWKVGRAEYRGEKESKSEFGRKNGSPLYALPSATPAKNGTLKKFVVSSGEKLSFGAGYDLFI